MKRREKWGNISASLDSQKCKRDREREKKNNNKEKNTQTHFPGLVF